jgi:hypothetical protein
MKLVLVMATTGEEHPERLEGLLAAMAKTQIKHSLEKIYVYDCGVSNEQVNGNGGQTWIHQYQDIYAIDY